jgi:hypothetical protein
MIETQKNAETLVKKYLDGQTSPREERELLDWLLTHRVPSEWQALVGMLSPSVGGAEADRWLDEDLTDEFDAGVRRRQKRVVWLTVGRVAAVAAVAVLVFMVGHRLSAPQPQPLMTEAVKPQPPVAERVVPVVADVAEPVVADVKPATPKRSAKAKPKPQTRPELSAEERALAFEKAMLRKEEEMWQHELARQEMLREYEEKLERVEREYADYMARIEQLEMQDEPLNVM